VVKHFPLRVSAVPRAAGEGRSHKVSGTMR
jgi:hypothetical protein